jgi:hypothetical protein
MNSKRLEILHTRIKFAFTCPIKISHDFVVVAVFYLRIQKWLEKQFLRLQEITRRRAREYKEYNDDNNTNTITLHLV